MSESSKKQTFLHGAALLALAAVIVKVIGALYKLPLNAIIGEQGFSYFYTAYDIYSVLLLVSTAGLPVAVSKMISQASSLGHYNQVRRIYRAARAIFLSLGVVSSLLMIAFCHQLAAFEKQPNAWAAIACLGPCAFLVCLLSTYRGFFQGQSNMIPTAVSEVIEAVCKLLVGIPAAMIILKTTGSLAYAAAGAILGVTAGSLLGAVYTGIFFHKDYKALPVTQEEPWRYGSIVKNLLSIAVPITIGSTGLQAMSLLETNLYMGQLLQTNLQAQADTMKGIYNMALTIYNMPCALTTPITISIIPAIAAYLTKCDDSGLRATEESAARVTALIALPCALGLSLLAEPVTALLGGYTGENLALASKCMAALGIGVFFYAVTQLTNAILQTHGHATLPVIHILLSGVLRLIVVYILSGNPKLGVMGVGIGCTLCNLCVAILNLIAIRRYVPQKPALIRNFLRPLLPGIIMGAAVYGCWWGLKYPLGISPTGISGRLILCALPVMVGVAIYAFAAVRCKSITREDCLLLPKGETIARLLRL